MKRCVLCLLALVLVFTATAGLASAQVTPTFKLGFKALADQIPGIVGTPLENEHWGANGDSLQQTSNGLMAWRKADNWTAFTDGSRTWINGPSGVQSRHNSERFSWEAQPVASAPSQTNMRALVENASLRTSDLPGGFSLTKAAWDSDNYFYTREYRSARYQQPGELWTAKSDLASMGYREVADEAVRNLSLDSSSVVPLVIKDTSQAKALQRLETVGPYHLTFITVIFSRNDICGIVDIYGDAATTHIAQATALAERIVDRLAGRTQ